METSGESEEVHEPSTAAEPNGGDGNGGDESRWADDLWGDESMAADQRTVRLIQVGLVTLIVLIVGGVLIFRALDSGDDGPEVAVGGSTTVAGAEAEPGGSPAPADTTAQTDGGWPSLVASRPDALGELEGAPGDVTDPPEPGVYVWSDYDGWHLWVVNGPDLGPVSGIITSNDTIGGARVVPDASGSAPIAGNQITLDLDDSEPISGVDFNPGFYAKTLVFDLKGPNGPLPAEDVHLGRAMAPAEAIPLVVEQQQAGG